MIKMFSKQPGVYTLEYLRSDHILSCSAAYKDKYVPARPLAWWSWRKRFSIAWQVFTGRLDAVQWPGEQ